MSRSTLIIPSCVSLVVLSVCSAAFAQGPPPAPVRVDAVRRETVQERRLVTGDLRAVRRARVAGEEPGLIITLPVEQGQVVKHGDVIATLDGRRLEIELAQLQAEHAAAGAIREERTADMEWRQRDLQNLQNLQTGGASNPKEMYDAESQVRIARTRVTTADLTLNVIAQRIELIRKRIADTAIKAPFDGVVIAKLAEQGEWLTEGAAVVEMISSGSIEAWLDVPQQYAQAVLGRQPSVSVLIEATGQIIDSSQLRAIPQVDPKARTFAVIVSLPNEHRQFAPGMSIRAWVPTGEQAEHLTLSRDAVMRNEVGSFVYVARSTAPDAPSIAAPADVQVLFGVGDRLVVTSAAVQAGDLVVVEGNERLFPTAPIIPMPTGAADASDHAQPHNESSHKRGG